LSSFTDDATRKPYSVDWDMNSRVSLYEGDITCIEADAIVSCNIGNLKSPGGSRLNNAIALKWHVQCFISQGFMLISYPDYYKLGLQLSTSKALKALI